jgi:flagellar P-ring protein precursor FlgI
VAVPPQYQANVPELIARLEPLPITMDVVARVAINERTGTVVMGGDVRLGPAAVAHGNLSVRIATQLDVSQPAPFSGGQTTVVPQTEIDVSEGQAQLISLDAGATLGDVVRALNTLGATPRDIIAVMQALKAAGALRAELVIL